MMKKYSLLTLIFLLAGIFMYSGCDKDDDNDTVSASCTEQGVITGIDIRRCACCGGWFIEIDNKTLRATTLPQEFLESLDPDEFPLHVFLEWSQPLTLCTADEIIVTCARRR